jgi:hypothetical protein
MKKIVIILLVMLLTISLRSYSQNPSKQDIFQKANNVTNKVNNVFAVFQPYLLKARQLFYDTKQLAGEVKKSSKAAFGKNRNINNTGVNGDMTTTTNTGQNNSYDTTQNGYNANSTYNQGTNNNNTGYNNTSTNPVNPQGSDYGNNVTNQNNNSQFNSNTQQYYLPDQNLPVNNPATVNNDGTGNWGNQNNGLYGNCLDVLTGTIMGLGEAEASPKSVDVIFVAANGTYQLWTPNYARNEIAAQYTSRGTAESAAKWSDINETEIAETRITISQFDQIQNNSQILNAVKNAREYSSSLTELNKMDGKVYAVKAELEDRTVYGLIAVVKQVGTDGSNGYLKIKIKAQGVGANGVINANSYLR